MDKSSLIHSRNDFFNSILHAIMLKPSSVDKLLQQDKYFILPDKNLTVMSPETGDLAIYFKGSFYEKDFEMFYSIWQIGNILKVGIALFDTVESAFSDDTHNELYQIWGKKHQVNVDSARGCNFYDWEFDASHLYENYQEQERYIFGIRHMHFRVMRIIHDECKKMKTIESLDIAEDSLDDVFKIDD